MKKTNIINFIKEEVIGSENTLLAWAVMAAVILIIGIGFYLNSPDASFHGVAGSREANVNFEYPVEIRNVHVLQGQRVKKGDLLIELDQSNLSAQIRQMNANISKLKAELSVREQMNRAIGNSGGNLAEDPLLIEIRQMEVERAYIERQRNNLYVFAEMDGIVGSVNFKRGERAPAFAPIVTISPGSPTFVQGFVNEELRTNVQTGSRVQITSFTNPQASVTGRVVSVGARFVEIPLRLSVMARAPSSGIWGREVTVEIPKDSEIILGEKVQISPLRSFFSGFDAVADDEKFSSESQTAPTRIQLPPALADRTAFEASGAVYLSDLKKYLIASDDTDKKNSPWLFLLSEDGQVDESPIEIPALGKIEDMESVSSDGGYIYVMSSLSSEKKGILNPTRNLLVRAKRSGRNLSETKSINFGNLLRMLIRESNDTTLQGLNDAGLDKLEVEAHTIRNGSLYIGLKAPSYPDSSTYLLLRIPELTSLFDKTPHATIEVWKSLHLNAEGGATQRPTDMLFVGDSLYFTASCKGSDCGSLWRVGENETTPKRIKGFTDLKPEGLAYNPDKNIFLITFDMGTQGSQFTLVSGPNSSGK